MQLLEVTHRHSFHIGLISYQIGHRKTWQLAHRYRLKGYRVTIYGFPFVFRPQRTPIFKDRPDQIVEFDVDAMSKHYGFGYVAMGGWSDADAADLDLPGGSPDVFVTCIGKIIPAAFLSGRTFLNAHPGLLPQNRGVDAFKWAVVNGWPIGVTLHVIDERIDAGRILRRQRIPVYPTDDLKTVADRAYQVECDLLSDYALWIQGADPGWQVDVAEHSLSKRRISDDQDRSLEELFVSNRSRFISLAADLSVHPHPSDTSSFR